ncbi:MAG: SH3 domain-containing protein [Pseudomonadota bacterium]
MHRFFAITFAALCIKTLGISVAVASPGVELVCYDRDFTATVGFDIDWSNAYIDTPADGEVIIPAVRDGPAGFEFAGDAWRLNGFLPEATLFTPSGQARCYQTKDNIKTLTFYGEELPHTWNVYAADGVGTGNVRSMPSILGGKVASLGDGEPVIILSNTDVFQDGFFWFKIEYGERERGYIWGALLCTNTDDDVQLSSTVRKCN